MPSDRIGRKSEHIPDQRKRVISRNEGAYYAADRRVVSMYMSLVYSESSTLSGLACEVAKEWKKKKDQHRMEIIFEGDETGKGAAEGRRFDGHRRGRLT